MGVAPPGWRKKIWEGNLQGKVASAPQAESAPPRQSKSSRFEGKLGRSGRWERLGSFFVLRATTEKEVNFFEEEKCKVHP